MGEGAVFSEAVDVQPSLEEGSDSFVSLLSVALTVIPMPVWGLAFQPFFSHFESVSPFSSSPLFLLLFGTIVPFGSAFLGVQSSHPFQLLGVVFQLIVRCRKKANMDPS